MATLPDAYAQKGINVQQERKATAEPDLSGYARGASALAQGDELVAESERRSQEALAVGLRDAAATRARGDAATAGAVERAAQARYAGEQAMGHAMMSGAEATNRAGQYAAEESDKAAQLTYQGQMALANAATKAADYNLRGATALASGIGDLGKGTFEIGKSIAIVEHHKDELRFQSAYSDALVNRIRLRSQFDGDADYGTMEERFSTAAMQGDESVIQGLDKPELQDKLRVKLAPTLEEDLARVRHKVVAHANGVELVEAQSALADLQKGALLATDPIEQDTLIRAAQAKIVALEGRGLLTPKQAAEEQNAWTYQYGKQWVLNKSPDERQSIILKALPLRSALASRESGNDPTRVNQLGYAGLYQFGAPRLADIGIYTPGVGENLGNWSKTGADAPAKWSGTFSVPGFPDVQTLQDFLRNPQAQQVAFQIHQQRMDQEIQANGLDKYIGETVGGVPITRDGLQAMLHIGGVGGAMQTLRSDGRNSPRDANGTSVLDYARMGAKTATTTGTPMDFVPLSELRAMADTAARQINDRERAQDVDAQRQTRIEAQLIKQKSDAEESNLLKDLFSDTPTQTAQSIVNNDNLTREAKERMIGIANRANKPDPLSAVSQRTTMDLLDRLRRPDGDPYKITDLNPIYDAYIRGDLSKGDLEFARKEFEAQRTPDGDNFAKRKAAFVKGIEAQIDKSNPLVGKIDESGKGNLYIFNWDLEKKVEEYRKSGKNPYDLLDPSKPDFMGKPEAIAPYQKTLQQSLKDAATKFNPAPGAGSRVQEVTGSKRIEPRREGESPAEYLKRTGAP